MKSDRDKAALDHLIVRDGTAHPTSHLPATVLAHGDVLDTVRTLRAERDLAREDLRRALDRVETLVLHGLEWSQAYMVEQLRTLKEQLRESVS